MKFKHRTLIYSLAWAGLLSACSIGEDKNAPVRNPPEVAENLIRYSGTLRSANGASVSGYQVLLENRITDERFETSIGSSGNFNIQVKPGVYDVLLTSGGTSPPISLQKTAVDLQADKTHDLQIGNHLSRLPTEIIGKLLDPGQSPLARQKIILLPSIARSTARIGKAEVPDPVMVETDSQGNFSVSLGKPGMDIAFDALLLAANAPGLDVRKMAKDYQFASEDEKTKFQKQADTYLKTHVVESINIEKPNGAMQVDLAFGATVRNLRGATGAPSVVPADAASLAEYEKNPAGTAAASLWRKVTDTAAHAISDAIPSAHAGEIIAKFLLIPGPIDGLGKIKSGTLFAGKIRPQNSGCRQTSFLNINNGVQPFDSGSAAYASKTRFCATREKSPLKYTHKINLQTERQSHYLFRDEANGTYALRVLNTNAGHTLRYASDSPTIVDIEYHLN